MHNREIRVYCREDEVISIHEGRAVKMSVCQRVGRLVFISLFAIIIDGVRPATAVDWEQLAPGTPVVVETDKLFARAGRWSVYTARWGIGCVMRIDRPTAAISVGGEAMSKLVLIVQLSRDHFSPGQFDDEDHYLNGLEMVLGRKRWDERKLSPYGYRGAAGLQTPFKGQIAKEFSKSGTLKISERGFVKSATPLGDVKQALSKLARCFARTR